MKIQSYNEIKPIKIYTCIEDTLTHPSSENTLRQLKRLVRHDLHAAHIFQPRLTQTYAGKEAKLFHAHRLQF